MSVVNSSNFGEQINHVELTTTTATIIIVIKVTEPDTEL